MRKQSNKANKKADNFGKGNVTPTQVAFLVDRYLSDNNFSETRSLFRTEASSLLSKSSVQEAPKSLLSLGAILNEYIGLKEQKVMVDQERIRLEQEKCRVQTLLQSFQNAMNAYNAVGSSPTPSIPTVAPKLAMTLPQSQPFTGSPAGFPVYKSPIAHPVSMPSNVGTQLANFSSPMASCPPAINKRKEVFSDAPPVAKRSRNKSSTRMFPDKIHSQESAQPSLPADSSPSNCVGGSLQNGSSVAKCLFNQSSTPIPANTSVPMTPPRANSSQSDKSVSPLEVSSTTNHDNDNTPEGVTTTRCTVISSKRVTVSPFKQIAYTMERNHCISTCSPVKTNLKRQAKREHVKGRLDFDGSDPPMNSDQPMADQISTSESEKEIDLFDIDLPSLDVIGTDFSFSEMLRDFDFECQGIGYSCQPATGAPMDTASGSSPESMDGDMEANQLMSEFSSTVTEVLSQKDTSMQGSDSLTAVKSVTRCIKIISPVKNQESSLD